jgi:3D (Asp-Asp-Asp) domain-containing protein
MYSIRTQGKFVKAKIKWFFIRERSMFSRPKIAFLILFVLFLARCVYLAGEEFAELGTTKYGVVRESTFASLAQAETLGVDTNGESVQTSTERGMDTSNEEETFPDPCTLRDVVCDVAEVSAYNAEVGQTDADPYTTASGQRVYEGGVANNCLPFGTKVRIGEKEYTVNDRMNSRYGCNHFDVFMWSHDEAVAFGRKKMLYAEIK